MKAEIIIGLIILSILGVFLSSSHLLMPETVNTILMLGLIIGFLVFVGLFWREQANDERDLVHINRSGRISFFVGAAIVVTGIVSQAVTHEIDSWLVYTLSGMVLTKIVSRIIDHFRS